MPPRPGDILDLDVTTLAYGGRGVARADDFVVFVRGALPGDRVRARVTARKRRHAEARVLELLTPSPERVPRRCPHAEDCGGCEWQALAYERQLEVKQRQVVEALEHVGGLVGYALEPILAMPDPWRYRNKMEYSFGEEAGRLVLGLHRRGSWREIVEVEDCLLASARMNAARATVAEACRELGLGAYDRAARRGLLRHLVVREGRASGDLLLNLYVHHRFPEEERLAELVASRCAPTSFGVTINDAPADAAVGEGPFMLFGPPSLRERIAGVELEVPATAFLQTNSEMCEQLYETAVRLAAPEPDECALDLYCGIGSFTLRLAREVAAVTGIEIQPEAVAAAERNALLNGADRATFVAGDVRPLLKDPRALGIDADCPLRPDLVTVDPPRAGLARKALQRAAALGASRIVYISCNPTTLAGNGAELAGLGYRLTRIAPVDMFPHTHHVETVALFEGIEPA
jgi:23S rRNA (uracil1939-C5)-methyltransferase